ncbi:hypothetical protein LV779_23985 [Streptomyces thinghirensis]|nr:hypothetical protein [Streptomyces thinghirensis]
MEVTCSDVHQRAGHVARMRSDLVLRRAGQVIGSGWGQINCTSPQVYRRLRGSRTGAGSCKPHTPSLPPQQVEPHRHRRRPARPRRSRTCGDCASTPTTARSSSVPTTTYPACCCWRQPGRRPVL